MHLRDRRPETEVRPVYTDGVVGEVARIMDDLAASQNRAREGT